MSKVLTANDLRDGDVVFLTPGVLWSREIDDAFVAGNDEESSQLETLGKRAEGANEVVAAYLIDVERDGAAIRPLRWREMLRTRGPSVRLDLGHQAEPLPVVDAIHAARREPVRVSL